MRGGVLVVALVLALGLVAPSVAQPIDLVLTPLARDGTPPPAATPRSAATPVLATPRGRDADDPGGIGSRLLGQQTAAQTTIAAYATREAAQATRIVELEVALAAV